jgi:hypothetical protein
VAGMTTQLQYPPVGSTTTPYRWHRSGSKEQRPSGAFSRGRDAASIFAPGQGGISP